MVETELVVMLVAHNPVTNVVFMSREHQVEEEAGVMFHLMHSSYVQEGM